MRRDQEALSPWFFSKNHIPARRGWYDTKWHNPVRGVWVHVRLWWEAGRWFASPKSPWWAALEHNRHWRGRLK
jgi:hypothetical protein